MRGADRDLSDLDEGVMAKRDRLGIWMASKVLAAVDLATEIASDDQVVETRAARLLNLGIAQLKYAISGGAPPHHFKF